MSFWVFLAVAVTFVCALPQKAPSVFDKAFDDKGREVTPFMRRMNISHDAGFGAMAGVLTGSNQLKANAGKLQGFFVTPCLSHGVYDNQPVSSFQTRYYHPTDFTYQIDTTYYFGDPNCVPKNSDVYFKTYYNGVINYDGLNNFFKNHTYTATLEFTDSVVYLANNALGKYLAVQMQGDCPCGGSWVPGQSRSVSSKECTADPNDQVFSNICKIISGMPDIFNYKWVSSNKYITSLDCFKSETDCYSQAVSPNFVREQIPESGNQDPDNCDYVRWGKYGNEITAAAANCESCVGLECDGCLFRELNPTWDPRTPQSDYNDWYDACPCIYKYGKEHEKEWLATYC